MVILSQNIVSLFNWYSSQPRPTAQGPLCSEGGVGWCLVTPWEREECTGQLSLIGFSHSCNTSCQLVVGCEQILSPLCHQCQIDCVIRWVVDHHIKYYWFADDVWLVTGNQSLSLFVTDFSLSLARDNDTRQDYKFARLTLFCVGGKQIKGKNQFQPCTTKN